MYVSLESMLNQVLVKISQKVLHILSSGFPALYKNQYGDQEIVSPLLEYGALKFVHPNSNATPAKLQIGV